MHLPAFLSREELERVERLCEEVVARWYARHHGEPWLYRTTNMAGLTDPSLHGSPDDLVALVELIADERILGVLRACGGHEPLFHNSQFFFEQRRESWDGDWHRDTQFDARDDDDERERMTRHTGVHFRIACEPDSFLEIVPGSHRRWDTDLELAIRRSSDPLIRSTAKMAGARHISLERGDALLFHAWSIHRGSYRTEPRRRTLDLIYGWPSACPHAVPSPYCFSDDSVLPLLSPSARRFYERFITAYRTKWEQSSG